MKKKGQNARARLGSARRVLVKVGSRALLGPDQGLDRAVFRSVAKDLAWLRERKVLAAVVSSGAVVAGRVKLGLSGKRLTMPQKQAAAAVGQTLLMEEWDKALSRFGLSAGQVLLTAEDLADRARFLNSSNTMEELFRLGVVPVINENDTVAVEEIRYGDNDHLATLIAGLMCAEALIILTDIDGFYDRDPGRDPNAKLITEVTESDSELFAAAGPSASPVGSGGMASKLEAARTVARRGIPTVIANAKKRGVVRSVIEGKPVGTLFVPAGKPLKGRKYWMAFAGEPRGKLVVDEGARRALEERGKSLLPSGVVAVEGSFRRGDMVLVVDEKGEEVARGLVGYSAEEVRKIKGLKSGQIAAILGEKLYDEVIHRDYLVLVSWNKCPRSRGREKDL